ncbi:MAG: alanine racemase [Bacillota bacterium]
MVRGPVWAEISLEAICCNTREVRRITRPEAKVMAIVKANGYGHGALEVSKAVLRNGADCLGVARLGEALDLRRQGIDASILVLGFTPPQEVAEAIRDDVTLAAYTEEQVVHISRTAVQHGKTAVVHIKVDTGMGRIGFLPGKQAAETIAKLARLSRIQLEGIFTHFATADEADKFYANLQAERFLDFLSTLSKMGVTFPVRHAANSAALIDLPETHLDMVRPGIILYGLYPSPEVARKIKLQPAMRVKAMVAHVKEVERGASISYGRTFIAKERTVIATLPLGYADGYSRLLSNKGEVLLHGRRAPVVGRVCMDQTMVDITKIPGVAPGDTAVVLGEQGDEAITAEELAGKIGSINYEVVCKFSARVPRVYCKG